MVIWGAQNLKTGEWNGLIKDLIDDAADIVASPLTVLKLRSFVVDFLLPLETDSNTLIIRIHFSFSWDVFFRPFNFVC